MVILTFKSKNTVKDSFEDKENVEYRKKKIMSEIYEGLLEMNSFKNSEILLIDSSYKVDENNEYIQDGEGNFEKTDAPLDQFVLIIGEEENECNIVKELEVYY